MFRDGGYLQVYNALIAVDEHRQIIVAAALMNHPADTDHPQPLLNRAVDSCGSVPE